MRFAAMTFSFGPGSLDSTCRAIAAQGFDCIDLAVGSRHQVDALGAAQDPLVQAEQVLDTVRQYGLDISEVFLLNFGTPINHPDPATRETGRMPFAGFAQFCREIGAESIMMSPGVLFDDIGEAASRRLAVHELCWQRGICAANGLQLNIEPHWHSLAESPAAAIWFCEQVRGLGLTLDYSHFIAQGYPQDAVEALHPYTRHLHARQAREGATNVALPDGTIDFERILGRLSRDRWDGVVCLEYNPSLIDHAPREIVLLRQELTGYLRPSSGAGAASGGLTRDQRWGRIVFDPTQCRACKLCETVCAIAHEGAARPALARINIDFDAFAATDPISGTVCAQCADARCLAACPVGAMSRDERTGAVVVDSTLCVGCMACRRACPWAVPKKHPELGIAIKCDLCGDREGGPVCVEMCPLSGRALRYARGSVAEQEAA